MLMRERVASIPQVVLDVVAKCLPSVFGNPLKHSKTQETEEDEKSVTHSSTSREQCDCILNNLRPRQGISGEVINCKPDGDEGHQIKETGCCICKNTGHDTLWVLLCIGDNSPNLFPENLCVLVDAFGGPSHRHCRSFVFSLTSLASHSSGLACCSSNPRSSVRYLDTHDGLGMQSLMRYPCVAPTMLTRTQRLSTLLMALMFLQVLAPIALASAGSTSSFNTATDAEVESLQQLGISPAADAEHGWLASQNGVSSTHLLHRDVTMIASR